MTDSQLEVEYSPPDPLVLPERPCRVLELPIRETRVLELPAPPVRELVISPAPVPGPPGVSAGHLTVLLGAHVNAGYVVAVDTDNLGRAASALERDDPDRVAGLALVAGEPGDLITVMRIGEWTRPSPGPTGPLYLGEHGELTPDHDTGAVCLQVGSAVTPTRVFVDLTTPVFDHLTAQEI